MENYNSKAEFKSPDQITELTQSLETIFGYIGNEIASHVVEGSPLDIMRAEFAVDDCEFAEIPDGALPLVVVEKWVNPDEDARWSYVISYKMTGTKISRQAAILKGENPVVEVDYRQAEPDEVQALVNDFQKFSQI